MTSILEGMNLHDLLKAYGIERPIDLAHAADIDRRHAWMIWHGHRHIGPKLALRIFDRKGIPLEALLRARVGPPPVPRGRPPKPRTGEAEA
jgi:hypothetical protein